MTFIDEENSFVEKETLTDECKKGFSLAETMIMLVIVSIILAVSAPLITRKAAADAQRLIMQGVSGGSVVTALGGSQTLGVGLTNPNGTFNFNGNTDDIRLHVNGNSILDGRVVIGDAGDYSVFLGNDGSIFEIGNINNANPVDAKTFEFNTSDGTTNLTNFPQFDYQHTRLLNNNNVIYNASVDGFIYLNLDTPVLNNETAQPIEIIYFTRVRTPGTQTNDAPIVTANDLEGNERTTVSISVSSVNSNNSATVPADYNHVARTYMIPVSKDTKFRCYTGTCLFIEAQSRTTN